MGNCKESMKPTNDKSKSLFGMLKRKPVEKDTSQTFADQCCALESTLTELIVVKTAELDAEIGRESYNKIALAHLKTMRWHIDSVIELAADYSELS